MGTSMTSRFGEPRNYERGFGGEAAAKTPFKNLLPPPCGKQAGAGASCGYGVQSQPACTGRLRSILQDFVMIGLAWPTLRLTENPYGGGRWRIFEVTAGGAAFSNTAAL